MFSTRKAEDLGGICICGEEVDNMDIHMTMHGYPRVNWTRNNLGDQCNICGYITNSIAKKSRHIIKYHGDGKYVCPICLYRKRGEICPICADDTVYSKSTLIWNYSNLRKYLTCGHIRLNRIRGGISIFVKRMILYRDGIISVNTVLSGGRIQWGIIIDFDRFETLEHPYPEIKDRYNIIREQLGGPIAHVRVNVDHDRGLEGHVELALRLKNTVEGLIDKFREGIYLIGYSSDNPRVPTCAKLM